VEEEAAVATAEDPLRLPRGVVNLFEPMT
jgi:hypothetical protein